MVAMARNHSKAVTSRRNQGTRQIKKIVLYCEGKNTEPSYFSWLKKSNCKVIPIIIKGRGIGSCVEFVEEANKKHNSTPRDRRDKLQQKWLIYDCDGHEDFWPSIKKAREYGFHVAFSNMCIEYWFALHFYDLGGAPIPQKGSSHSKAQIELINRAIELYNKKREVKVKPYDEDSKAVDEDFFELMMTIHPDTHQYRIIEAYERAKVVHEDKKKNGAESTESVTTMYELIRELGVVEETSDGTLILSKR